MPRRRIKPQDSFWLELDRPDNLMVITSLMWTTEPVDPDRLRALLRERVLERYPVFRQRPVVHTGLLRWGYWEDDPDFDLDQHIDVRQMPGRGDRAALQEYVGAQRSVPLDPERPLWMVHVLQGYEGGTAIVQRYHHAMADGIRLTQVMLGILDPMDGGDASLMARVGSHGPVHGDRGAVGPAAALLHTAGSVVKIGLWENPGNALDGHPGVAKTAAWTDPVSLPLLKDLAAATGTTVNDVATTLVAGAMARYLEASPDPRRLTQGDDDLAWMIPVNLEPPGKEPPRELGNYFALVLAVLPHGPAAFRERLAQVHRRIARIRDSWEPMITFGLSRGLALTPPVLGTALIRFLAAKAVGVLTNVPGPHSQMALAGVPVAGAVGWAPTSARQALTVSIFSYSDQVTIGFGTDVAIVPDADALVAAFDAELAAATAEVLPDRAVDDRAVAATTAPSAGA